MRHHRLQALGAIFVFAVFSTTAADAQHFDGLPDGVNQAKRDGRPLVIFFTYDERSGYRSRGYVVEKNAKPRDRRFAIGASSMPHVDLCLCKPRTAFTKMKHANSAAPPTAL